MKVSASAVKTHLDCSRKNYFQRVLRLPKIPKGHFEFGTTLHEVLERYMLQDQYGKGESLYPDGWDKNVTPVEAATIRRLVEMAIDKGYLSRHPERRVELQVGQDYQGKGKPFPITEGADLIGYIDLDEPLEIIDYKTSKDPKWFLSKAKLAKDTQMLTYAYAKVMELRARGELVPECITLTHIQFCKDPTNLQVRRTSVDVPVPEIEAHWRDTVQRSTEEMLSYADTENWGDVEPAAEGSGACQKYGGCEFLDICGGRETVENFRSRVGRLLKNSGETDKQQIGADQPLFPSPNNLPNTMSQPGLSAFLNILKKDGPQTPAADPSPIVSTEEPPSEPTPQPEEQADAEWPQAPWAFPGCNACGGTGWNSRGGACRICDGMQRKVDGPQSVQFDIDYEADSGIPFWEPKVAAEEKQPTRQKAEKAQPQEPPKVPEATPQPVRPVDPPPAPGTFDAQEIIEGPKKGRGRPKRDGFVLFINCHPTKTWRKIISLDGVFDRLGRAMALKAAKPSFWAMDTWKRRDAIRDCAGELVAELKNCAVYVAGNDPDLMTLAAALRPFAEEEVEGVA